MTSCAVIGGGIAGLTAAYRLVQHELDVTIFEAGAQAGGVLRTERAGGYLVEYGPNSLRARTALLDEMIAALGLDDEVVPADPMARNRYVVRGGRLAALPASPPGLLTSTFLSFAGKLRLLREPFIRPAAPEAEESVAAFVRRRLGQEALAYGANPFVAGIFAGDPEQLSLRHAFPALHALEQRHGSLLKGLIRQAKAAKRTRTEAPRGGVFSFRDGLARLPEALAARLAGRLHLRTPVTGLARRAQGWTLTVEREGGVEERRFDAVVCTVPLHRLGALRFDAGVDLTPLFAVPYPPVSVVALGFRREDVAHPLDGFGVLLPAVERDFRILGALFSSSVFPGRAPEGHVLLTTLVGGARHPDLAREPAPALQDVVLHDLSRLLGVRGAPTLARHWCWPHAIPQYTPGYGAVKGLLDDLEARHPGLCFAGNYRRGISVADAMASGDEAARRLTG